jgi:hypothetical protein
MNWAGYSKNMRPRDARPGSIAGAILLICGLASCYVFDWSDDASPAVRGDNDTAGDDDAASGDVWRDSTSGLMWRNVDDCCYTWEEAKSYCQNLNLGEYSDWRLPTIGELRSLIRGCDATETGGPGPGGRYWSPELKGDGWWHWSSSIVADASGVAWFVDFGYAGVSNSAFDNDGDVRCVR